MLLGANEVSREAEKDGHPFSRRVLVHAGKDGFTLGEAKKKGWKCLSESAPHEQLRWRIILLYLAFFSSEAEASSLPIPTFDLISLMK